MIEGVQPIDEAGSGQEQCDQDPCCSKVLLFEGNRHTNVKNEKVVQDRRQPVKLLWLGRMQKIYY